jgi:hypothetical protein
MPITFACPECDKTFKVSDEMAGRKGKCNACGATMLIPGKVKASSSSNGSAKSRDEIDDEDDRDYEDEPRSRTRRKRDDDDDYEVVRTKSRRRDDDDDFDDEPEGEERPRRKKKRKQKKARSLMGLWVALGIGSILVIMGGAYFAVAFALNIWPFGAAGEAMKFMPDNCKILVSVKWDEIEKSQLFQDLKSANPDFDKALGGNNDSELQFLRKKGIDSILMGLSGEADKLVGGKPNGCMVVTLREGTSGKELLDSRKDSSSYKETKAGSYTVYENNKDAFSVVSSKMIIVGDKDVVSAILKRDKKPEIPEGLKAVMDQVSFSKPLAVAADTKGALTAEKVPLLMLVGLDKIGAEIEGIALQASVGADINLECFVNCKSAQGANDLKKKIDEQAKGPSVPKEAADITNSLTVTTSGGTLTAALTVKGETLKNLTKMFPGVSGAPPDRAAGRRSRLNNPAGTDQPSGTNQPSGPAVNPQTNPQQRNNPGQQGRPGGARPGRPGGGGRPGSPPG